MRKVDHLLRVAARSAFQNGVIVRIGRNEFQRPRYRDYFPPRRSPRLIAFSVMLATFMEILDTSVANVSLPQIAGSLSATTDESASGM